MAGQTVAGIRKCSVIDCNWKIRKKKMEKEASVHFGTCFYWQEETEEIALYRRSAVNWRAGQEAAGQGVSEAHMVLGGHQCYRPAARALGRYQPWRHL